jgi:C-terminal processing protease CtpA/Prc
VKALLMFFFVLFAAAPTFAEKTTCTEVEQGTLRMVELMEQDYVVRAERKETHLVEFVGVGFMLNIVGDIVGVIPNSPASAAGVPTGALVIAVDGVPVNILYLDEIAAAIRGSEEDGTTVKVSFRLKDGSTKDYSFTRTKLTADKKVLILRMCK